MCASARQDSTGRRAEAARRSAPDPHFPVWKTVLFDGGGDEQAEALLDLEAECRRLTGRIGYRLGFEIAELEDLGRDFYIYLMEGGERRLRASPHQGDMTAWLARCCIHFLVDTHRARQKQVCEVPFTAEALEVPDEAGCVETAVLEKLDREYRRLRVASALKAISRPERNLLFLHYLAGLTHVQIAERLGCAPAAVRQRCSRAVRRLRARLEKRSGADAIGSASVAVLARARAASPPGTGARAG